MRRGLNPPTNLVTALSSQEHEKQTPCITNHSRDGMPDYKLTSSTQDVASSKCSGRET